MTGVVTREAIREWLFSMEDEKYRQFNSTLIPGEEALIGVRTPMLRKYAGELFNAWEGDVDRLLEKIGDDYHEELLLQGILIGQQKKPESDRLFHQIEGFVPKIRNWAICDTFCTGLKAVKQYPEKTYEFLQQYLESRRTYDIRFGLVMLLEYYITEEYIQRIFAKVQQLKSQDYYVRMAAAWLISMCFVKFYDETKEFMQDCTLDDFTYNKALQKARESLRITPQHKEELKGMGRKFVP